MREPKGLLDPDAPTGRMERGYASSELVKLDQSYLCMNCLGPASWVDVMLLQYVCSQECDAAIWIRRNWILSHLTELYERDRKRAQERRPDVNNEIPKQRIDPGF